MSLVLHGGHGKSLFVASGSIRIVHEHLQERRDKAILIRHISAVEVKKPGAFDGYIQFSFAGATPHEAVAEVEKAREAWLDVAREQGLPIPAAQYRPAMPQSAAGKIRKVQLRDQLFGEG